MKKIGIISSDPILSKYYQNSISKNGTNKFMFKYGMKNEVSVDIESIPSHIILYNLYEGEDFNFNDYLVLILDINLTDYELMELIKQIKLSNKSLPIILLKEMKNASKIMFKDYIEDEVYFLRNPVFGEELMSMVHAILNNSFLQRNSVVAFEFHYN